MRPFSSDKCAWCSKSIDGTFLPRCLKSLPLPSCLQRLVVSNDFRNVMGCKVWGQILRRAVIVLWMYAYIASCIPSTRGPEAVFIRAKSNIQGKALASARFDFIWNLYLGQCEALGRVGQEERWNDGQGTIACVILHCRFISDKQLRNNWWCIQTPHKEDYKRLEGDKPQLGCREDRSAVWPCLRLWLPWEIKVLPIQLRFQHSARGTTNVRHTTNLVLCIYTV